MRPRVYSLQSLQDGELDIRVILGWRMTYMTKGHPYIMHHGYIPSPIVEFALVHDASKLGFYPRVLILKYSNLFYVGTLYERLLCGLLHVILG